MERVAIVTPRDQAGELRIERKLLHDWVLQVTFKDFCRQFLKENRIFLDFLAVERVGIAATRDRAGDLRLERKLLHNWVLLVIFKEFCCHIPKEN